MLCPLFNPPPLDLRIKSDEIHLWRASLDQSVSQLHRLRQTLSSDERMRAERFRFEQDRKHFVAGRGILRMILGRYLNVEPDRMQFCYGKHGKPELSDALGKRNILFNMSDSEGLALYAFTRSHEIGVDIESIREISEMDQIAQSFFSSGENAVFCSIPNGKKKEAFFNCWTRKEAFIKAIGEGFSQPLDKFEVSLVPGESAKLLKIEGDSMRASRWSIQELKPASGFAAAFAVKKRSWQLSCWRWGSRLPGLQDSTSVYRN